MKGRCSEQFVNMLSASNEWSLNNNNSNSQIREGDEDDDEQQQIKSLNINKKNMMLGTEELGRGGGSARVVMEKPSQEQIQQEQQAPLKCPRCDSTNTKFCYYNNYSLSQPRHFCKACKRYWTRGGTLRTVPVGGGCRKNKRIRRIISPNFSSAATNSSSSNNNSSSNIITTTESSSRAFNNSHQSLNPNGGGGGGGGAHLMNNSPLLYGLPTNLVSSSPHEAIINGFPFSSSYDNNHHQLGGISGGLGFSSAGGMILGGGDHRNGYSTNTPKQILHDLISNSSPFHGSNSNTSTTNTTPTTTTLPSMSMSSLLGSTLHQHQQKFNFETLFPYDLDLQIKGVGSHENEGVYIKDDTVKLECQVQNGYDQIHENHNNHHQQPVGESDPSINMWNANNSNGNSIGVNWLDPNYSNLGSSSVPSLI
ncbi:hypothetical protein V2J09_019509 [Rumex salicifolius]